MALHDSKNLDAREVRQKDQDLQAPDRGSVDILGFCRMLKHSNTTTQSQAIYAKDGEEQQVITDGDLSQLLQPQCFLAPKLGGCSDDPRSSTSVLALKGRSTRFAPALAGWAPLRNQQPKNNQFPKTKTLGWSASKRRQAHCRK